MVPCGATTISSNPPKSHASPRARLRLPGTGRAEAKAASARGIVLGRHREEMAVLTPSMQKVSVG
jgi:hypothetical protein